MAEIDLGEGGNEPVSMIDSDGKFTEAFTTALPGYLGKETLTKDDGSPIKMFETTPNLGSLAKMAYDSKTALGKKMDNVIQKPGENATEQEVKDYMTALDTARGAPDSIDAYVVPEDKIEVVDQFFPKLAQDRYKEVAFKNGATVGAYQEMMGVAIELAHEQITAHAQSVKEAEDKVITSIKTNHPGEGLAIAGKMVFNALTKFNKNNPEFLAKLKDGDVFNEPTDFENWNTSGVSPQNFQAWLSIAQELKISHSVNGAQDVSSGSEISDILPASAKVLGNK